MNHRGSGLASFCATMLLAAVSLPGISIAADKEAPRSQERIVNLGDSITDGQTYALLVTQALREAGKPVPKFFGAGIGGDTAAGMRKRLDRDVLSHRPTMVMLSCGINDVGTGVKPAQYQADVTAIAERLKSAHVRLVLLTTTNLELAPEEPRLDEINRVLHTIAKQYDLTIAEVYDRMQATRKTEPHLWEDGCHLNFAGYRAMTRAVLDALGDADVPVPKVLRPELLPGVVGQWRVLASKEPRPALDEKTAAAVSPSGGEWHDYALPETKSVGFWWLDQERQRGVSVSLQQQFAPAKSFLAVAEVQSPTEKPMFLNLGGELQAVWLNGARVFGPGDSNRGWHPGSDRKPVRLRAGKNQIIVETNNHFFISLTDNDDW